MPKQSVVIDLPEDVYNKYKEQALQTDSTIEAEIIEVVAKGVPTIVSDKLSAELEGLVMQLAFLDNVALGRVASSKFSHKDATRIEALHFKSQDTGLNETEKKELSELMKRFDRWFVLRNEALGLLLKD